MKTCSHRASRLTAFRLHASTVHADQPSGEVQSPQGSSKRKGWPSKAQC